MPESLGGPKRAPELRADLLAVVRQAEALADFAPTLRLIDREGGILTPELAFVGHDHVKIDLDWFEDHAGHDIVVMDGYGKCTDECWKTIACPNCKKEDRCRLPTDHAGDCSKDRDNRRTG